MKKKLLLGFIFINLFTILTIVTVRAENLQLHLNGKSFTESYKYEPLKKEYIKKEESIGKYNDTYLNFYVNENYEENKKNLLKLQKEKGFLIKEKGKEGDFLIILNQENISYDILSLNRDLNNLYSKEDLKKLAPKIKLKLLLF